MRCEFEWTCDVTDWDRERDPWLREHTGALLYECELEYGHEGSHQSSARGLPIDRPSNSTEKAWEWEKKLAELCSG